MVSSVDTDQWMIILLAMGTGKVRPRGEGEVRVTVRRVTGGRTYILVNRVYDKVCTLRDGSETAWPADNFDGWVPCDDDKVRLFVLVYLLAGCDFLPAISGMPFEKMWTAALQSVREPGVFRKPLFLEEGGTWVLDEMEAVKLLGTMFFFKHEAAFRTVWRSPAEILRKFDGDVSRYVEEIRFVIWRKRDKKSTSTCPSFMSKVLQAKRAGSVLGYWQGGLEEKMRAQVWNGKGWGLNPKGTWAEGEKLTAENCVLWLSEHSYIGPDRKTVTLTCGCAPEKATKHRCRSCGCEGRSCSLMCGCRGSCQMERAHSNEVSQTGDKGREDGRQRTRRRHVCSRGGRRG
ncbi:unnamed protein product [Scytosiphon promiscuus]